ncbi:hypothetical protein [Burkholderia sp. BC1]|uniref:hypothetical protein n=1 Tax=Burkholderia sp. BC1 TaxID=1095370 RepID=UPI0040442A94
MAGLTYEALTKHTEREIRDAMQRAAACELGSYSLGLALGETRAARALWDALVVTLDRAHAAEIRADGERFEALAYAKRSATA